MSNKREVLTSVCEDIYKILEDLDHELGYIESASSCTTIPRSCEQILLAVAEETLNLGIKNLQVRVVR